MTCKARYAGGQMHCDYCALVWDFGDPDPPVCKVKGSEITDECHDEELRKIKEVLSDEREESTRGC